MKIFGDERSGNCLKVKYTADYLGLDYQWEAVDILQGESRTEAFLAVNPQGQVPAVVFPDGRALAQSNAIIRFLAAGTALLPPDPYLQAKVDEYLFWEQYSHEPYVAVCRFHMVYLGKPRDSRESWRVERGEAALDYLERSLSQRQWLAAEQLTVADIALYAYTSMASEGGFELASRPSVVRWLADCREALGLDS